jgi:ATP-dependent protease Clp ATPase subunit
MSTTGNIYAHFLKSAEKAERVRVKAKVALIGPSGPGETYSALRLAQY